MKREINYSYNKDTYVPSTTIKEQTINTNYLDLRRKKKSL